MYPKNEAIGDPIKYGSSSIIIIFSSQKSEFLKDDTVLTSLLNSISLDSDVKIMLLFFALF